MSHTSYSHDRRPWRTRSLWSPLLAGAGIFALVLAALFRFFVPGQVVKFPLNEYEIMTLQGSGVSYFSAKQLTELSGVTMRATYTIKGEVGTSQALKRPGVAVWQSFVAIEDLTNRAPFQYTYAQFALDRRTGQIVPWTGNTVNAAHNLAASGQSYVWPIGTAKRTYQVYDRTALRPEPARFAGTATTAGIATYRFVESVTGQHVGSLTLPGSLVGSSATSVTLPEYYTATITYWVDPVTGDPLKISENELLTLRDSSGATRLVLLRGHLTTTPASVRTVAAPDRTSLGKIALFCTVIPLAALILGLVLLAAGLALSRRRRPSGQDELPERIPEEVLSSVG